MSWLQLSGSTIQHIDGGLTADWGRLGGEGGSNFPATRYDPNDPNKCPNNLQDPFYISIDPNIDTSCGPFDKQPNDPCVVDACGKLDGDVRENCEGAPLPNCIPCTCNQAADLKQDAQAAVLEGHVMATIICYVGVGCCM